MSGGDKFVKLRTWVFLAVLVLIYPFVLCLAVVSWVFKLFFKSRKRIAGEIALVTGGAKGLGKEIAIKLAENRCDVAIADVDQPEAESTAKYLRDTYHVRALGFKADVSRFDEVKKLSERIKDELGIVTILVNNAGVMTFSTTVDTAPSEIQNMIDTNLTSSIWTVRVFLEDMRKICRGHIVGIGSLSGVILCHRQLVYTATKYALRGFMNALAGEMYALDCEYIKTTHVIPFFLDTNEKVLEVRNRAGLRLYPTIAGREAAEAIVDGIRTNEVNIYLPGFIALVFRLMELLPKKWQTKLINATTTREKLLNADY